jgi:signal transduction histidine kinase/CheY-like chemotaxis protein
VNALSRLGSRQCPDYAPRVAVDITQEINNEASLTQSHREAQAANQAKSEFMALVSHEIRTPLNSIVGFSSLAGMATSNSKRTEYLDIIEQSSHSLMRLVNDILDISKIEAGRLELETMPVNLHQLISTIENNFQPQASLKNINFQITLDKNVPVWVSTDQLRLRQILANLLSNAIKFTQTGEVICRISLMPKQGSDGFSPVRFEVRDTGIGIPEDKQSLLFESFRQLDASITRKYGGTGLGLAIVRQLVRLMGGNITVASTEGAGSTFIVELPMPAIAAPPEISEPVIRALNIPLSLLVVEDNKTSRILMHDTLTALGHTVTLAIDGNQALEHVASEPFNLILMDLRMPDMDGLEATRRIRTLESEAGRARTPVIVVTADTDVQTREDCLNAGIDAILTKPAPLAKLAAIIAEQTEGTTGIVRAKTAPDDAPLLTLQSLSDMRNDVLRIRKFTVLLLTDVEEEMSSLQVSLQAQDRQALEQTAHTLKGLCSHLQDPLLKDLAKRLQAGAQLAALPELSATADLLQSAINKIIARERKMEAL